MTNQPNYTGGLIVIAVIVVFIFLKRILKGQPIGPADFPEPIVRDYRSFGQALEDGWEADRRAFLAFKQLAPDATQETQRSLPLHYDPAADAKAQGVGE